MEQRHPEYMNTRPVGRLLLEFSAPAIIATLVSVTYNLIARIFVGQKIGMIGITAITVSFPVMLVILALAMMVSTGAMTLISIKIGEKNCDKAEQILGQALFMFLGISIPIVLFGQIFVEDLLRFFGASKEALPYAKSYLSIIIWGTPLQMLTFGVNNFIRAEGRPNIAMTSMLISALANIFFDWLFLVHMEIGIEGAGYSNILALAISASWICWLYLSGRTLLKWRLRFFRPNWPLMGRIALFGMVPLVMQTSSALLHYVQNHLYGYYGAIYGQETGLSGIDGADLAIALSGILSIIIMLIVMPMTGLNQGLQPIVGHNVGAQRPERVLHSLKLALLTSAAFGTVCWLFAMLRPDWLLFPFVQKDVAAYDEIFKMGIYATRIVFLAAPLIGLNVVTGGYFQSHGRPWLSLTLTLLRQLIFLLPALYVMPWLFEKVFHRFGLDGIWYAYSVTDAMAFLVTAFFLFHEIRSKKRKIAQMKLSKSDSKAF